MLTGDVRLNSTTHSILAAAIEVHRVMGAGLLESIYHPCFNYELAARGHRCVVQRPLAIKYKTIELGTVYRVDLVVDDLVVVEVKAVDALAPVHVAQVLTYLKLTGCPAGLLINFNVPRLMDGVRRVLLPRDGGDRGGNGSTRRNEATERNQ